MEISLRFNTPFKRVSFLALTIGCITLAISLATWTQQSRYNNIYYSESHYQWLPAAATYNGQVERYWSLDRDCLASFAQSRIANLRKELENHQKTRPEKPDPEFGFNQDSQRRLRDALFNEKYVKWRLKESSLRSDLDSAIKGLSYLGYRGVREGEVNQQKFYTSNYSLGSLFGHPTKKDNRTTEEKFRDNLYSALQLTTFPESERSDIFKNCAVESNVAYQYFRTSHHSNIDDWPEDHPIFFWLGLLLAVGGFLGSYGYNASAWVFRNTAGHLVSWVKTGSVKSRDAATSTVTKASLDMSVGTAKPSDAEDKKIDPTPSE